MKLIGHYQLERRIARGGYAELWRASAAGPGGFQKRVALKVLLPFAAEDAGFVSSFFEEARLVSVLSHPSVVQIFELGPTYMVLEYIDGMDLAGLLARARLPVPVAITVLHAVLTALAYAHDKAIVHRDITPHNVLLSKDGIVKLTDFGIAKAAERSARTKTGEIKGHFAYLSPEQAFGRAVDRRSDLFALGLLAFELLTGERAYAAPDEFAVLRRAQAARVDLTLAPSVFQPWLQKLLAREPELRFQRGVDALTALHALGVMPASESEVAALVRAHATEPAAVLDDAEAPLQTVVVRAPPARPKGGVAAAGVVAVLAAGFGLWRTFRPREVLPAPAPLVLGATLPAPTNEVVEAPGYLSINARPWAAVSVDGVQVVEETPLRRHALRPGRHSVSLRRANGEHVTFEVDIVAGETLTKSHTWGKPVQVIP